MKKINYLWVILISFLSCNKEVPSQFSQEALDDAFITVEGEAILFKDILETYQGQTLVIDIWASWCGDCIKGMPQVKELQKQYTDVTYLFLSLDKSQEAWKKGIDKYRVKGQHYFMKSGWKGAFGTFVNLDWIPRYMVVDRQGTIKLFKAVSANDKHIKQYLK